MKALIQKQTSTNTSDEFILAEQMYNHIKMVDQVIVHHAWKQMHS